MVEAINLYWHNPRPTQDQDTILTREQPTKRQITRQKVILASIDCIYREGFHAAHTNKIAEAAGVSWGVLQYHFGDKDGLLQAVIDYVFDDFANTLSQTEFNERALKKRIRHLIDVVWLLVNQKEYRVSVAILRNAGKSQQSKINGQKQLKAWAKKTSQLWDRLFENHQLDPQRSEVARHLLFAAIRGLVDEINPQGNIATVSIEMECDALADAIHHILKK